MTELTSMQADGQYPYYRVPVPRPYEERLERVSSSEFLKFTLRYADTDQFGWLL